MREKPQQVIGQSPALAEALNHLSSLAAIDRPVLVIGERGTGKELAAERLHFLSQRWSNSLLKVNCGAITETLLESELFGHEAGAFTGATKLHVGRFERADGGTLFLDELGTMSLRLQEKLLRLIEYGEFERVGGQKTLQVDVRVIAATNADLPTLANEGSFRWDLLDRLSFDVVRLPPLRERPEDVEDLANHFAMKFCAELGWAIFPGFSHQALRQMQQHPWPGNIRELKNTVERSVYRWGNQPEPVNIMVMDPFNQAKQSHLVTPSADGTGQLDGLSINRPISPAERLSGNAKHAGTPRQATDQIQLPTDLRQWLDETERDLTQRALEASNHHQKDAAKRLGLSYDQMRSLVRKHSLHTRPKRGSQKQQSN